MDDDGRARLPQVIIVHMVVSGSKGEIETIVRVELDAANIGLAFNGRHGRRLRRRPYLDCKLNEAKLGRQNHQRLVRLQPPIRPRYSVCMYNTILHACTAPLTFCIHV